MMDISWDVIYYGLPLCMRQKIYHRKRDVDSKKYNGLFNCFDESTASYCSWRLGVRKPETVSKPQCWGVRQRILTAHQC